MHQELAFPASMESKTNKPCCGEHDGATELSNMDNSSWHFSHSTVLRLQLTGENFGGEIGKKSGIRKNL